MSEKDMQALFAARLQEAGHRAIHLERKTGAGRADILCDGALYELKQRICGRTHALRFIAQLLSYRTSLEVEGIEVTRVVLVAQEFDEAARQAAQEWGVECLFFEVGLEPREVKEIASAAMPPAEPEMICSVLPTTIDQPHTAIQRWTLEGLPVSESLPRVVENIRRGYEGGLYGPHDVGWVEARIAELKHCAEMAKVCGSDALFWVAHQCRVARRHRYEKLRIMAGRNLWARRHGLATLSEMEFNRKVWRTLVKLDRGTDAERETGRPRHAGAFSLAEARRRT